MTLVDAAYEVLALASVLSLLYCLVRHGALLIPWTLIVVPLLLTAPHHRARTWSQLPEHVESAVSVGGELITLALASALVWSLAKGLRLLLGRGLPRTPHPPS